MSENHLAGPNPGVERGLQRLADGVWLSSGRAVVVEGEGGLAVVDPGDEAVGSVAQPLGALQETLDLERVTGKRVKWLVLTHGHEDHTANLHVFRDRFRDAALVAHPHGPFGADLPIGGETVLPGLAGAVLLATPGHSPWGDDVSVFLPESSILLSGDLVQPKGDTWEQVFYPSPYPFFTDGAIYCASLERLLNFSFSTLVTGHREVRRGAEARRWVQLTLAAIRRVERAVLDWEGAADLGAAAIPMWQQLAAERGISDEFQRARLDDRVGPSVFERFDLPGIRYYWRRTRGGL